MGRGLETIDILKYAKATYPDASEVNVKGTFPMTDLIRQYLDRCCHQHYVSAINAEVVPGLVELEVAVPRSRPAVW